MPPFPAEAHVVCTTLGACKELSEWYHTVVVDGPGPGDSCGAGGGGFRVPDVPGAVQKQFLYAVCLSKSGRKADDR